MNPIETPQVQLEELLQLFFPQTLTEVGTFHDAEESTIPSDANTLLNHCEHMTVTIEDFHGSEVDVKVLQEKELQTHYTRKILLTRKSDGHVVQFGIVRLDMSVLPEVVQQKIRQRKIPLGRILISHDVMRAVKLDKLFRIEAGQELASHFGIQRGESVYGRTAWMYCNGEPAIELLEVVNLPV